MRTASCSRKVPLLGCLCALARSMQSGRGKTAWGGALVMGLVKEECLVGLQVRIGVAGLN